MVEVNAVGVIVAKAEAVDAVKAALLALIEPSLAEGGCVSYGIYESSEPMTFVTIETWRSAEDLATHMQSPHLQQAFGALADALIAPPGLHVLTPVSG